MFTWKARVRAALARPQPGAPARVPGCCASLTQQPGRPAIKEHEVSQLEADRPVRWGIMWLSPISPSNSALGTRAATESTTSTSIWPEPTSVLVRSEEHTSELQSLRH